jgi:hypothetical protein
MRTLVLLGVLLAPVSAAAQLISVDFQDSVPFTAVGTNGVSRDVPVASGVGQWWNYSRVAPGPGNGGWNDRGFLRYVWRSYASSGSGDDAEQAGFSDGGMRFRPSSGWPSDTFYGRMRIYVESPIIPGSGGDTTRQLKFFMWHTDVFDGDQRVIGFFDNGANCGASNTSAICFHLERNICHTTDVASVQIPVGQWVHLQWAWRHGSRGTSYVKVWRNANSVNNPTAQDLDLSCELAQGTSWPKDNVGYDAQWWIGNGANTGTRFAQDFVLRVMDFQLDSTFDPSWSPAGPTPPQNLRILTQ